MKRFSKEHFKLASKYLEEELGLKNYDSGDLQAALNRIWSRYKKENPMAGFEDWDLNDPIQRQLYEELKVYDEDGLDEEFADILEHYSKIERDIDERLANEKES